MAIRVTVYAAEALREARSLSTDDRVEIAHEIASQARADAPVLTGAYRDGITVEAEGEHVAVVDDDPDAGYKEYGTSDTPAHAVLTDTARQYGRYSGVQPKGRSRG